MSSTVTSIAKRQEHVSAERAALAAAITAGAETRRLLVRAEKALQSGRGVLSALEEKLDGEKHHVEKAKESDSRRTAAAVRNKSSASPDASATRAARLRVQACEDEIEVAQGAIERLEQDLAQAEAAVQQAVVDTIAARAACLAPVAEQIVARIRQARLEIASGRAQLSELLAGIERGAPKLENTIAALTASASIRAPFEAEALKSGIHEVTILNVTSAEAAAKEEAIAAIRAFIDQLATDAAAELPIS
jgi:hypothetical protein